MVRGLLHALAQVAEVGYHNHMVDQKPPADKSSAPTEPEQRFKEHLLGLGLLTEITPPVPENASANNRHPIAKTGTNANPVSDLVIKERR